MRWASASALPIKPRLKRLDFSFTHCSPPHTARSGGEKVIQEIMDPRRGVERLLRKYLFPHLQATYDDLSRAVVADGGADLVVSGELVYPAPLVAEKTGVRWAFYIAAPMSFISAYDLPVVAPFPRVSAALRPLGPTVCRAAIRFGKTITRSWSKPVRMLRAELGLKPGADPIYEGKYSPRLYWRFFLPSLRRLNQIGRRILLSPVSLFTTARPAPEAGRQPH